jgi:hypothetical protein
MASFTVKFKEKRLLVSIGRFLVVLAALWAIGMSVTLFFTPITIDEITAAALPNDSGSVEHNTIQQSWYQVQGLWGSFILVLVAGFYGLGTYLARRKAYRLLGVMCLIAFVFSCVAGFSIGLLYLPSALCLTLGTLLLWLSRGSD